MLAGMRSSVLAGAPAASRAAIACAPRSRLVIEAAHKKGAGSTKNGRDSESKRRGVKVYGGQPVKAGGIIVRQTGSTVRAQGRNGAPAWAAAAAAAACGRRGGSGGRCTAASLLASPAVRGIS